MTKGTIIPGERKLGPLLDDPSPGAWPEAEPQHGRYVKLVPLDAAQHADELFDLVGGESNGWLWDYMLEGPFTDRQQFYEHVERKQKMDDPFWAIVVNGNASDGDGDGDSRSGTGTGSSGERVLGYLSFLRIVPKDRVLEVGNLMFSPKMQKTPASTEVVYLLAKYVFESLQYRRLEWKCNDLNVPSKNAALRFGFSYEGLFRKHFILKGRSRDTAWFSMLDDGWPVVKASMEAWLDPNNFDSKTGNQIQRLVDIRASLSNK